MFAPGNIDEGSNGSNRNVGIHWPSGLVDWASILRVSIDTTRRTSLRKSCIRPWRRSKGSEGSRHSRVSAKECAVALGRFWAIVPADKLSLRAEHQLAVIRARQYPGIHYQRAYEIAIWATPVLDVLQMRSDLVKHGATEGTLAYFGSPPNGIEVPT
jgi:hypothetical protein